VSLHGEGGQRHRSVVTWLVGREPVNDSVAMVSFDGRFVVPNLRLPE
jgi:hypothetical protein